jgi:WXG100 family type VII secretion target
MLADLSSELHAKMEVLRWDVEALIGGGWQGNAARGFAEGFEQWQAGAREVVEALAQMGQLLGATGRDYGQTDEDSAANLWRAGEGL